MCEIVESRARWLWISIKLRASLGSRRATIVASTSLYPARKSAPYLPMYWLALSFYYFLIVTLLTKIATLQSSVNRPDHACLLTCIIRQANDYKLISRLENSLIHLLQCSPDCATSMSITTSQTLNGLLMNHWKIKLCKFTPWKILPFKILFTIQYILVKSEIRKTLFDIGNKSLLLSPWESALSNWTIKNCILISTFSFASAM